MKELRKNGEEKGNLKNVLLAGFGMFGLSTALIGAYCGYRLGFHNGGVSGANYAISVVGKVFGDDTLNKLVEYGVENHLWYK